MACAIGASLGGRASRGAAASARPRLGTGFRDEQRGGLHLSFDVFIGNSVGTSMTAPRSRFYCGRRCQSLWRIGKFPNWIGGMV
jgi:hypothetical protein